VKDGKQDAPGVLKVAPKEMEERSVLTRRKYATQA